MPVRVALNREYVSTEAAIGPDDELALIPPVSGGATGAATGPRIAVRVTDEPLSLEAVSASVADPAAGAIVSFQGMTREVERLEYEAYREMAEERIEAIVRECAERHGLIAAAAEHRVGTRRPRRAERHRRRLVGPSPGGLCRRPRGDRPDQGGGADLEEGDRRRLRALGRGGGAVSDDAGDGGSPTSTTRGRRGWSTSAARTASERRAVAEATLRMSPETARAVERGDAPKGDVVGTARIAGIQAAKRTAELIPLAHPLALTFVDVRAEIDAGAGDDPARGRGADGRAHRGRDGGARRPLRSRR